MSNPVNENELIDHQKDVGGKRVTLDALKDNILTTQFVYPEGTQLTICIITLKNGFNVIGESACADPAMYNKEIGDRIAQDNAEKKIWPLMGYALKQELYLQSQKGLGDTFLDRMKNEHAELEERTLKLGTFIVGNELYKSLNEDQQLLLTAQHKAMAEYHRILGLRIYANS